jgi:hypothetical protein
VLVKASVGQYLAGDKGGTLDISKHFDSGVVVGGYATITNVSPDEFTKGKCRFRWICSPPARAGRDA